MLQIGDLSPQERSNQLPENNHKPFTIAAIGDIHVGRFGWGPYSDLFREISEKADVLLLCGDLTHGGTVEEADSLSRQLAQCTIPVIGVLGNHDYAAGKQKEITDILKGEMVLLDKEPFEIKGVGFAGVKGFAGGYEQFMQSGFGEEAMKVFVQETLNETLKLESQLSILETKKKVVALHYSPIRATLVGESEEIFPFLGSSRLAEPLDNYSVDAVFHGHAHHGTLEGKTLKGIPVYNVSLPIMQKKQENQPYFLTTI